MSPRRSDEFIISELFCTMQSIEPTGAWLECVRQLDERSYLVPKLLEMAQTLLDEDKYHAPQLVTIPGGRESTPIGQYTGLSGHQLSVGAKIIEVRDGWHRLSLCIVPEYPVEGTTFVRSVAEHSWTHFADGLELRHVSGNDFLVRYQRQRPLYAPGSP